MQGPQTNAREQQNYHYQWSHNLWYPEARAEHALQQTFVADWNRTSAERTREAGKGATGDSPVLRARTRGETLELPFDVLRGGLQPWAPLLQQQQ